MAVNYDLNDDGVIDVNDVRYLLKYLEGTLTDEEQAAVVAKLDGITPSITAVSDMLDAISIEISANSDTLLPLGARFTSYINNKEGKNGKRITIGRDVDEDMVYNKTYIVTGPVEIK